MGKLFDLNKILGRAESDDSELTAFEKDIVSLDETGPIEQSDEYEEEEFEELAEEEYVDEYSESDEYAEENSDEEYSDESEEEFTDENSEEYVDEQSEDEYYEESTEEYVDYDAPSESDEYTDQDSEEYTEEISEEEYYDESSDEYTEVSDETVIINSLEEIEYPDEVDISAVPAPKAEPEEIELSLGFDEVRLDTASINAEELSEFIVSGRTHKQEGEPGATSKSGNASELPPELNADEVVDLDASADNKSSEEKKPIDPKSLLKYAGIAAACILLIVIGVIVIKVSGRRSTIPVHYTAQGIPYCDELLGAGSELNNIEMIGQHGIGTAIDTRVAEASASPVDTPEPEPDNNPNPGYNENDFVVNTRIAIELITVKADLKIRFINAENGKLIPNIPFKVTVTTPSGGTNNWSDDDKDGIIYHSSLAEGSYKVHIEPLDGEKYEGYSWPADKSVTIKDTIEFAQVDVESEVKDATQVNESTEDTASRGNTSQVDPSNTVEYLESAERPVYTEIAKDTITNPLAALVLNTPDSVVLVSEVTNEHSDDDSGENTEEKPEDRPEDNHEEKPADNPIEMPTLSLDLSQTSLSLKAGTQGEFTVSYSVTVVESCSLSVESSDTRVATATISDKTVTVTAVAGGNAEITVTAVTETNHEVPNAVIVVKICSVTVEDVDMSTQLKDKSGNDVYVFENDEYRKATYADYDKFDKFYIISGTKLTGWQTIDGSTYYYDSDGKPVTGTQVIQGVSYMFAADGKMTSTTGILGIDVSKWNGSIDWAAVKAAGVEYVIIRVGYRGSTAGALVDDSRFVANINGAKGAGLKVGVYFVTQAINDVEAVYEASMVLDRIKGYSLDMPVFLDVEPSSGRGDKIDKATRTSVIIAFCETIRSAGYVAGIYANKTWLDSKMDTSQFGNYKIWVAHYSSVCGYTGRYDMWQYTDKGTISGVNGSVDMNLRYT